MRILTSLILSALVTAPAQAATPIAGYWRNPIGSAIIEVAPCGRLLCGKVVWASARGQREVAKNTSNVVGTTVLSGLRPANAGWSGSLYVPDDNIHVAARLEPLGNRQLKLTGCALLGLICRTQIWTRVETLPAQGG